MEDITSTLQPFFAMAAIKLVAKFVHKLLLLSVFPAACGIISQALPVSVAIKVAVCSVRTQLFV